MILDNFPKVLWINLEKSIDRRKYMEELLNGYGIQHTRIRAINGLDWRDPELKTFCFKNRMISSAENACTCSHFKALQYFVDNITDDKIIIFEDDVSFEFLKYIPYNWSEFEINLPKNYNVVQLAISTTKVVTPNLVKTNPENNYYCTCAYLITKSAAKQILSNYYLKSYSKFDLSRAVWATADTALYSLPNTYSIPIFTYCAKDSTIHSRHLNAHIDSKQQQLNMWTKINTEKLMTI